jgi:hypothetical protein
VFGRVIKGIEIIELIANEEGRDVDFGKVQYRDPVPKNPVRVKSVRIDCV